MYSRVRKCSLSAALLYKYNEAFNKGNWQASVGERELEQQTNRNLCT